VQSIKLTRAIGKGGITGFFADYLKKRGNKAALGEGGEGDSALIAF
jgi:hypothetical protein